MASKSLVANAFVCARCQRHLARSTAAPLKPALSATPLFNVPRRAKLFFHAGALRKNQPVENKKGGPWANDLEDSEISPLRHGGPPKDAAFEESAVEKSNGEASAADIELVQDVSVPWYLQEQVEQPDANPFLERQRIPELPENPPPILEPLLKHASIDLGLDYLTVLDLRTLDPPPALGANLIMLFGSARSEKHLNVSADKLCRWLRSHYKLAPVADGLLGRNELKLKLKRKNRRARMMSAAGASSPSDPDDGISTGWICVNVGTVEDGPDKKAKNTEIAHESPTYVGFGTEIDGAKIVVQIMTESKRGDLDLESLWKEALDDSIGHKEAARHTRDDRLGQRRAEGSPNGHEAAPKRSNRRSSVNAQSLPRHSPGGLSHQHVRSFHAYARTRAAEGTASLTLNDATVNQEVISRLTSSNHSPEPQPKEAIETLDTNYPKAVYANANTETLRKQLSYLQSQKPNLGVWHLGKDQDDLSSTAFLRSFHQSVPIIPEADHFLAIFELHCHAIKIGHPGYTRDRLLKLLREMQATAILIPEEIFLTAFETVLMAHNALDPEYKTQSKRDWERRRSTEILSHALRRVFRFAFEILERMESYGHDVRSKRVFTILHDAIANPVFESRSPSSTESSLEAPAPAKLAVNQHAQFRHLFRRALDSLYIAPPADDALYTHILRAYIAATPSDWSSFWEFWHHLSRLMRPRTPEMYSIMFNGVASTEHAAKCQETLMYMFPELERENPKIECKGEVAVAVLECLIKAKVPRDAPPWEEMWEAAERGL